MEDLIKEIQERTGLSADSVLEVVTMVADYMKNALPEELVRQITRYLGDVASTTGGPTTDAVSVAADMAARAAASAASAVSTAIDAVSEVLPTPDNK